MAHIHSHCSLYSVHCCSPNTSHAKSSTHTEPLPSRWSFSSAQTTYKPHKENVVLLAPGRREVSLKKKQCFHNIIYKFETVLVGLKVSLTLSDPSKFCERVGVYECIKYERIGGSVTLCLCFAGRCNKGGQCLASLSLRRHTYGPPTVLYLTIWCILHTKMAGSVWNHQLQFDWLVLHNFHK